MSESVAGEYGWLRSGSTRSTGRTHQCGSAHFAGYGQERERKRSKEADFDHHLVKPVDSADLKVVLAQVHPPSS